MRHGMLVTLLILCGPLPHAAFALATPADIALADTLRISGSQGVPEPTTLSLLAGVLLLTWAATRRLASTRIDHHRTGERNG